MKGIEIYPRRCTKLKETKHNSLDTNMAKDKHQVADAENAENAERNQRNKRDEGNEGNQINEGNEGNQRESEGKFSGKGTNSVATAGTKSIAGAKSVTGPRISRPRSVPRERFSVRGRVSSSDAEEDEKYSKEYQQQERRYLTGLSQYRDRQRHEDESEYYGGFEYGREEESSGESEETEEAEEMDEMDEGETTDAESEEGEAVLREHVERNRGVTGRAAAGGAGAARRKHAAGVRALGRKVGISEEDYYRAPRSEYTMDSGPLIGAVEQLGEMQSGESALERMEWQVMLEAVLTGDVVAGEKTRLVRGSAMSSKAVTEAYREELWNEVRACAFGRSADEQRRLVLEQRSRADDVLREVMEFHLVLPEDLRRAPYQRRLAHAVQAVDAVLERLERCERLWPTLKAMRRDRPACAQRKFVAQVDALVAWSSASQEIARQSDTLRRWIGGSEAALVERLLSEKDIREVFNGQLFKSLEHWTFKGKKCYRSYHEDFERLGLPSFLGSLFVLARFPMRLLEQLMRARLAYASRLRSPTALTVEELMADLRSYIALAVDIRVAYLQCCAPQGGWVALSAQDCQSASFDQSTLECVCTYMRLVGLKMLGTPKRQNAQGVLGVLGTQGARGAQAQEAQGLLAAQAALPRSILTLRSAVEDLEREWRLLQNVGLYVPRCSKEIALQVTRIASRLAQSLGSYIQKQIAGPPIESAGSADARAQMMNHWYTSTMENYSQIRRRLSRLANVLADHFENTLLFTVPAARRAQFYERLRAGGHTLYYSGALARGGCYVFVPPGLCGRPDEVARILGATELGTDFSRVPPAHLAALHEFKWWTAQDPEEEKEKFETEEKKNSEGRGNRNGDEQMGEGKNGIEEMEEGKNYGDERKGNGNYGNTYGNDHGEHYEENYANVKKANDNYANNEGAKGSNYSLKKRAGKDKLDDGVKEKSSSNIQGSEKSSSNIHSLEKGSSANIHSNIEKGSSVDNRSEKKGTENNYEGAKIKNEETSEGKRGDKKEQRSVRKKEIEKKERCRSNSPRSPVQLRPTRRATRGQSQGTPAEVYQENTYNENTYNENTYNENTYNENTYNENTYNNHPYHEHADNDHPAYPPAVENEFVPPSARRSPEYVLVVVPPETVSWHGPTVGFEQPEVAVDAPSAGRVLLVVRGGGPEGSRQVSRAAGYFRRCVGDSVGRGARRTSSVGAVEHSLRALRKHFFSITCATIDSAPTLRRKCRAVGSCEELANNCFSYVKDQARDSMRTMGPARRANVVRKLMRMALEWLSFVIDDCQASDPRTFRWCVSALEFSMAVTAGFNIMALRNADFAALKQKVAGCMSLLISHFDIMGARARQRRQREERMEGRAGSAGSARRIEDGPARRTESALSERYAEYLRRDAGAVLRLREDRMDLVAQIEAQRSAILREQQAVGRVLDGRDTENRLLAGLASSFSSVSIRWRKGKYLGGGTCGSVYASTNLDTGGPMSVKEIRLRRGGHGGQSIEATVHAIRQEMTVLQLLSHPNIVQFFGVEVHRDRVFIFMEYCSGGSLAQLLEYGRIEDEAIVQIYALQLLEGLAYMHHLGVVHRDIKPENILLDHTGVIKIIDFGSARIIHRGKLRRGEKYRGEMKNRMDDDIMKNRMDDDIMENRMDDVIVKNSTDNKGMIQSIIKNTKGSDEGISQKGEGITGNPKKSLTISKNASTINFSNVPSPANFSKNANADAYSNSYPNPNSNPNPNSPTNPAVLATAPLEGTPMYMSPEAIKGGPQGRLGAIDIWALGCCVLEMITGRRPWANLDNEFAVMYHIAAGHAPAIPSEEEIGPQARHFLTQCFDTDPARRKSAVELLQDPWIREIRREAFGDDA